LQLAARSSFSVGYRSSRLCPWLISVVRIQQRWNGSENDFDVQKNRPMARVIAIESDALAICGPAAAADLPKPCDAWPTDKVISNARRVPGELVFSYRTGPDDAHVASEDIEELGYFIQARFTKQRSNRRHPGIKPQLPRRFPLRFGRGVRCQIILETSLLNTIVRNFKHLKYLP